MRLKMIFIMPLSFISIDQAYSTTPKQLVSRTEQPANQTEFVEDPFISADAPLRIPFGSIRPIHTATSLPLPEKVKMMGVQGDVLVEVWVNELGVPAKAMTVWGPKELHKYAETNSFLWRFAPYLQNGKPIPVRFRIKFEIKLFAGRPFPYRTLPLGYNI